METPTLFVAPECLAPVRMRYHADEIVVARRNEAGTLAAEAVKNPRQGMFNVVADGALQGLAWRVEGMRDPTTGESTPFSGTFPESAHADWLAAQ